MSGSSLDGMDVGLIEISKSHNTFNYKILLVETIPYSSFWAKALKEIYTYTGEKLIEYDFAYSEYCGNIINEFCKKNNLVAKLISFHGHTIFHNPAQKYTYALGNLSTLSAITDSQVIGRFRDTDISLGGQGAPLMGIADTLLFSEYRINLNLGGICNISVNHDSPLAYDICPCNQLFNYVYEELGIEYDDKGHMASSGTINTELLKSLNNDSYYKLPPPKSLDNNYIKNYSIQKLTVDILSQDKLRTISEFVSNQIFDNLSNLFNKSIISSNDTVLISGGGAHNKFLLENLKNKISTIGVKLENIPNELIDYKELVLMALLAFLRKNNEFNVLSKFTGAYKDSKSGGIYG